MSASLDPKPVGDPLLGRVLDGRFRIIAPIARGGMGAVYKAEQAPLGRLVALKVLAPRGDEAGNTEFRRRFLLEASTSAKLTHPNTVRVFDYGQTEDGFFFIAMELLEGKTLKQMIAERGALPIDRAVDVAKQVCRSLREAHRLGVVHRDIKPGNVMLVDRGGEEAAKVLDFGLAKDVSAGAAGDGNDATQTGVFLGSPKYVSPEQVQGEALDARSDIYSLGVVLYEMLSGRPPFAHEQPMQVLMSHVRDAPPKLTAPAGMDPIPPNLEALVLRCLAKSPDDRWPDMEAVLVALKEWQGTSSMSGDLSLSISQDMDARSGVHSVANDPVPSDTPLGLMTTVEPKPAFPEARPESTTSTEMTGEGRASGVLVAGVVALLLVVGAGIWFFTRPTSEATAAPPPRAPAPHALTTEPALATGPLTTATGLAPGVATTVTTGPAPDPTVEAPVPTVLVSLRSTPSGAMVRIGDREYGPTPAEVEITGPLAAPGATIELEFSRAGFRTSTETVTIEGTTLEVSSRMARAARAPGGGAATGAARSGGDVHVDGYRDSPY